MVVTSADTGKFDEVPGDYTRICVGAPVAGWLSYTDSADAAGEFSPDGVTRSTDTLLLYFTSGTTSQPKLVEHTHASYPIGHLSTMYWIGVQPGDVHLNISSPGWAKHAWSNVFAPWNAEATVLIYNYRRFDPAALLEQVRRCEVTTFCAPPTVWRMLIQGRPRQPGRAARGCRRGRAAQPGDHRAGTRRGGASPSGTASARPRRPRWSATAPVSCCAPVPWAARCRATGWS